MRSRRTGVFIAAAALAVSALGAPPALAAAPVRHTSAPASTKTPNGARPTGLGAAKARISPTASQSAANAKALVAAESSASARARATGRPVAVGSEITQRTEVAANPDGTFTFTSDAQPVRVLRNGAWQAIDTRLVRNGDGTWSPAAAADTAVFSGGGTSPMVTLTDPASGKSVSLGWPGTLPAPTVHGDAATYPNVLPGVDLRLTANATGYGEVLIIHDGKAAANPRLSHLRFTLGTSAGVKVTAGSDGSITASDGTTGNTIFSGGRPLLWDSSHTAHTGAVPGPDQAGSGRITAVPTTVSAPAGTTRTLTLSPPAASLTGPGVAYPEYLDPEMTGGRQYYSEVASFGGKWNSTTNSTSVGSGIIEVGDCGYSSCAYEWNGTWYYGYKFRDYFQMDTAPLAPRNGLKANLYSSTFNIQQTGNSNNCTSQPTNLYSAGGIGSGTAWPGPLDTYQSQVTSNAGGGSSCPASNDAFNAMPFTSSANGATNLTFGIAAPSETNELQYKTFSDNPSLTVVYNFAPLAPSNLAVSGAVTCTSTTYESSAKPTLSAKGTDNNPSPLDLKLNFAVDNAAESSTVESGTSSQIANNSTASWTGGTALANNTGYEFRASATNIVPAGTGGAPDVTGPDSGWYAFTSLSALPSAAPTVYSHDYPASQWGQASSSPGTFTVGTGGASSIAGFAYSFDGGSDSEPVPATGDCTYLSDGGLGTSRATTGFGNGSGELELLTGSTAQIRIPAGLSVGRHTLYVRSFDHAHNASAESSYVFYVPADYQTASQPTTIIDAATLDKSLSGANASEASLQANCCGLTWYGNQQLFFSNTTQNDTFTVGFNVPDSGTWQLGTDMTTASDYGQLGIELDGSTYLANTSATPWDGYSSAVSMHYLGLGTPYLTTGAHTLTFTAVSKNSASSNYRAGLDYLELNPTNRYEAETLSSSAPTAGSVFAQNYSGNPWSGGEQLMLDNSAAGTSFTVTFNAPVESDYALGVNLTTASDYGTVRFDLDPATSNINLDNTASTPIDAYSTAVSTQYAFLGGVHLTAGSHVLKLTVVGTNSATVNNRYNAGIDFVEAVPVTGATDASFTAAMNNHGIISDNSSTAISSFDQGGTNLSLQALEATGIAPGTATAAGSTFSLGGATFTMPQLRADGSGNVVGDNVVADGQTIPLANVSASAVVLLATSTCGASPSGNATINYTSGGPQSSQPAIASVPDWISGSSGSAAEVLGHRDDSTNGSVPDSAKQPRLYEIVLPVNPNGTLSSITLPAFSPTFLSSSCDQALHILAIGTRSTAAVPSADGGGAWVGSYSAPIDEAITPAGGSFSNETLREVVQPSVTGSGYVRLRLSNAHSNAQVQFDAVTLAAQSSGEATLSTPVTVTFGNSTSVTIPAGGDATSDPVALPSLTGGSGDLTVSLHIASSSTVTLAPIHDTTNVVTYYASGNSSSNTDGTAFTSANSTLGLYYVAGLDVSDSTSTDGTIAVLGDQTATQAPAWTTNTWAAALPAAFSADSVTVPGGVANTSTSGPSAATDWWHLGENGGGTAYDAGSGDKNLTLNGATWSTDTPGTGSSSGSLSLNGTSQYAATGASAIDTSGSFTVSAWVKLSSTAHNQVAVAEDGSSESGFYLGYLTANSGEWAFYFTSADATSPTIQAEATASGATAGTWTHLVGVYNASSKTSELFVNGVLSSTATGVTSWKASGDLTVGRDLYNGAATDYFGGEISDVRTWGSVLPGTQVSAAFHDTGASTLTTANALAAFDQSTQQEPNLRDVVLSVGANDVLDGTSAATIESHITALVAGVESEYIPDQSNKVIQVFVTTILPLGLASGDARETTRQAVNAWITSTYQNGLSPDIATAVADPNNINQISPTYLSGGVPTASYYSQIASAVASDVQNAIPPISLVVKGPNPFAVRR
jgi:hypothetical protein